MSAASVRTELSSPFLNASYRLAGLVCKGQNMVAALVSLAPPSDTEVETDRGNKKLANILPSVRPIPWGGHVCDAHTTIEKRQVC